MELLQLREKEIFETLNKIKKFKFAVIGGYAVNCYALPRFSVDCDIVSVDDKESVGISKELEKYGYIKTDANEIETPYHGEFVRYEKELRQDFKVSIDLFIKEILDRQTNATFTSKWVFENSRLRILKGKTIIKQLRLRVINPDALFVMKFVTCRTSDIRDIFMIMPKIKNIGWAREEIARRCNFKEKFDKIKNKITSVKFKDNLQGVYGIIDEKLFEKHKEALLKMEK